MDDQARDRAVSLLTYYFEQALPPTRHELLGDRRVEMAEIVDSIIDAAVKRIEQAQFDTKAAS